MSVFDGDESVHTDDVLERLVGRQKVGNRVVQSAPVLLADWGAIADVCRKLGFLRVVEHLVHYRGKPQPLELPEFHLMNHVQKTALLDELHVLPARDYLRLRDDLSNPVYRCHDVSKLDDFSCLAEYLRHVHQHVNKAEQLIPSLALIHEHWLANYRQVLKLLIHHLVRLRAQIVQNSLQYSVLDKHRPIALVLLCYCVTVRIKLWVIDSLTDCVQRRLNALVVQILIIRTSLRADPELLRPG